MDPSEICFLGSPLVVSWPFLEWHSSNAWYRSFHPLRSWSDWVLPSPKDTGRCTWHCGHRRPAACWAVSRFTAWDWRVGRRAPLPGLIEPPPFFPFPCPLLPARFFLFSSLLY